MHGEIVHAVTRFNRVFSLLCVLALLPNSPDASQLSLETAAFFSLHKFSPLSVI
jgi:hypothetical protein